MKRFIFAAVLALAGLVCGSAAFAQTATPPPTATVNLTWGASTSTGIAGYNLYRESQSGACTVGGAGTCTLVNPAPIVGLTATDTIPQGTNVWYVARTTMPGCAAHTLGTCESGNSNEVSVSFFAVPGAPGNFSCSITITGGTVAGTCH